MYIDMSIDKFFSDEIQEYLRVVAPYYRFTKFEVYDDAMQIYVEAKPWELDKLQSLAGAN